ncbi:MAG: T9SS type A sorting domain-containing protein [Bacteroidales bacterium]|jgi:photosystem II stability/assembly factor-like uncharacterized protein|nr:T9SS type A sorting domain-containing protein [Bacteroidales bacterium]
MKNLYLFLFLFVCSVTNAQQFNPTNGPTSGMETSKFVFVEGDLMFTGYGYHLLRSDNGGENWHIVTANFADNEILPTSMIRKGDYIFLSSWLGDRIYRSSDNGDTWDAISTGYSNTMINPSLKPNRLEVSGENLIMSSVNFTAISTDMGLSWQRIEAIPEDITDGVNQLETGLYISSQDNQSPFPHHFIYKSLDNGTTWEQLPSVPSIPSPGIAMQQGTSAFAELNGYLYSSCAPLNGHGLQRSNDNGATWENVGAAYAFNTGKCVRNYDGVLYFTDMSGAYKSTDEGASWEEFLNADYDFPCADAGYITRHNGKLWISTQKGPISYNEATGEVSDPVIRNGSLTSMKAANGVILGLEYGKLYTSVDHGNSWTNVTNNFGENTEVRHFSVDGNTWHAGAIKDSYLNLFKSTDYGQSWSVVSTTPDGSGGTAFFSYGPQLFATGTGADIAIYKSTDNGATWNQTSLTVEGDPLSYNAAVQGFEKHGDMIFADIGYGFAFSADGGETWTARKLASDGKVVGWPNNFIRYDDWSYQILNSTDNGATWTLTTDGFPILAGIIQYAGGLGMVNGRVYMLNKMESGDLGPYPGYYYYIDNGSTSWTPAVNLGQIPWDVVSIDGTSETDLYVSTFDDGVWTNSNNTGIEAATGTNRFILVYPNPAMDQLHVECEFTGGLLSIMDFTGRIISQSPFVNSRQEVNISSLKTGMYIISIDGVDKRYQSKFIKR